MAMNLNVAAHDGSSFTAEVTDKETSLLVRLVGELDLPATDILGMITADAANGARRVEVDLAALSFCDASGIRELISLQDRLSHPRRTVTFHGVRPHIRRLMTITGSDQRLNLIDRGEPRR